MADLIELPREQGGKVYVQPDAVEALADCGYGVCWLQTRDIGRVLILLSAKEVRARLLREKADE